MFYLIASAIITVIYNVSAYLFTGDFNLSKAIFVSIMLFVALLICFSLCVIAKKSDKKIREILKKLK